MDFTDLEIIFAVLLAALIVSVICSSGKPE